MKQKITKEEFKKKVAGEAKAMVAAGVPLTLTECKKRAEEVISLYYEVV